MRRLLAAIVLLAALAWVAWRFLDRREVAVPAAAVDSAGTGVRAARLFFAAASGDSLVSESREIIEAATLRDRIAALVAELDRGPRSGGLAALPAGTAALHVYLDEGGLLTLDLSRSFQRGFRGGTGGEYLAIASIVRTLAANVPEVKRVMIVCGGEPIASLGGHLPLDQPLDIADWP